MKIHCKACKKVAKQLAKVISTRRRGQPFEAPDQSTIPILSVFGTVGEISKRKYCHSCRDLGKEFTRWETVGYWTRDDNLAVGVGIDDSPSYPTLKPLQQSLYIIAIDPTASYGRTYLVNLYPLEKGAPHDICGRVIDRHEVSCDLIKGWLQCCDLTHGEYCTSGLTSRLPPDARPTRLLLVDLENHCLSYGTLTDKYAALSYVWGQVNSLRTTHANIQDFLKPGGLDFVSGDLHIPQTIKDFMKLALRLGIRYAWVDSLCIVQDGDDIQQQLNGMAAIFSSAYLTIVSEGPDANSGLIGAGSGGKPRDRPSYMLRLPNMTCVLDDNTINPNDPQIWQQRAWTFQEGLFSRRLLTFDIFGILNWVCPRFYWHEVEQEPSEALDWMPHNPSISIDWKYIGLSELNFTWPDMRRWCDLVEEYVPRELSFQADGMNAVAGLISVIESGSPGGFFYGLPELFFDTFLLWDVLEGHFAEMREVNGLPSWSFLGWKGGPSTQLDLFWWRFSMDHIFLDRPDQGYGSDCEIVSIVDWYKESRSSSLVPVANQFHVCRSQWVDQPPEGWTKHMSNEIGSPYFMHESIDDGQKFRYPIALPQAGARSENDKFLGRLRFKTKRGWLKIGNLIQQDTDDDSGNDPESSHHSAINVSLVDDLGNWSGIIRLPRKEVYDLTTVPNVVQKKAPMELIAVAMGNVRNDSFPKHSDVFSVYRLDIPEWDCEERPKDADFYQFYFVLCIEWRGDIAYRRGLGRVEKSAWERLPLEEIDVVLE
ncbi:uncharacterized protein BP5553_10149 [Venustampulla echinocandica]|uniref:Heterokaryon incompatibility domain-containing protein n=1 Tax=Venustampulla echinocandica TaxID=2656787 RepID=A0A370TAF8_9HELO|nr:uncharacterized protein BP5553_10149 [Venustampulla echinocandica]RDL30804.1 hypothetical protein BP5553_10149 [Venustampulla echinocandica]